MSRWIEQWERLDAEEPITNGARHSHQLLEQSFRALTAPERASAVQAIGAVLGGDWTHRRLSALWLIDRLELIELLPELRAHAARLGTGDQPDAHREARRVQNLIDRLPEIASANPADFEGELDGLTTRILMPLRATKTVDLDALGALRALVSAARRDGHFDDQIPVRLAGKLWFVFSAMLAEADHAREPEPIRREAHRYEEVLLRAFGV